MMEQTELEDFLDLIVAGDVSPVMEYYYTKNIDLRTVTETGETALHVAAYHGNKLIVTFLLQCNPELNAEIVSITDHRGYTPLYHAVARGDMFISLSLIGHGATKKVYDYSLHAACRRGYANIARHLLAAYNELDVFNVNEEDCNGRTAFYLACYFGHHDLVDMLLKIDNINIDQNGGEDQFSPLHASIQQKHDDIFEELVIHGADVDISDDWGDTPIFTAINVNSLDCVKILVDYDADLAFCNKKGNMPLHIAALQDRDEILAYFVDDANVALDSAGANGTTALHACAFRGSLRGVKILLRAGANPNVLDDDGNTPLDLARMKNRSEVMSFMRFWSTSGWKNKVLRRSDIQAPRNNAQPIAVTPDSIALADRMAAILIEEEENAKNKVIQKKNKNKHNKKKKKSVGFKNIVQSSNDDDCADMPPLEKDTAAIAIDNFSGKTIVDFLSCPITLGVMVDPVIAADGHTYDRAAIQDWFGRCRKDRRPITSPTTGETLGSVELKDNLIVKSIIKSL